ncbi:hypothetical protein [Desulfobulbus elongatus]|uniref:hypothetical protein n=1 Tax=Desulfobulbus elongatus TaxID=53332 RepID=UPI000481BA07|nr:hypothetical protein [Desulfobulbus elongatus]
MDRMIKLFEATKRLDVLVWENKEGTGGYLSIKHKPRTRDTQGEALVFHTDVPDLVKALTQAALELSSRGWYFAGYKHGFDDGEEERTRPVSSALAWKNISLMEEPLNPSSSKQIQERLN